ncbi:hypothetical protein PMAYCL1PPCAC_31842, partial [Pristionchus mayeri]
KLSLESARSLLIMRAFFFFHSSVSLKCFFFASHVSFAVDASSVACWKKCLKISSIALFIEMSQDRFLPSPTERSLLAHTDDAEKDGAKDW